jgi:hypothetical protein
MSGVFNCGPLFDLPVSTELLNKTSQQNLSIKPLNGTSQPKPQRNFSTETSTELLNRHRNQTSQPDLHIYRFIKQREHFFVVRDYYYAFLIFSLLQDHFQ